VTASVQMQSTIGKSGRKLKEVHIVEEKVYVTLEEEEDREPCR
jgi:hypothetical protein